MGYRWVLKDSEEGVFRWSTSDKKDFSVYHDGRDFRSALGAGWGRGIDLESWNYPPSTEFRIVAMKNSRVIDTHTRYADNTDYYTKEVSIYNGDTIRLERREYEYVSPPSMPSYISVSPTEKVEIGDSINISWGTGTGAISYRLERCVNGGSWIQIYNDNNRNYNDIAQESWRTLQYRVRSYADNDNYDGYSSYRTSDVIIVISMPKLKFKINNESKTAEKGWVKVDDQLIEIEKIWAKVNGALKEVE